MEKICEFCTAFRPVVYCKADTAYLCLSCDAKVHSANALSNRHLRTLLCDSCRNQPAYAHCLDHRMFLCRGCDHNIHGVSSQHQKPLVSSFMGCPAAKDFAGLWGFELDEADKSNFLDQLFSAPHISVHPSDFHKESRRRIGSSSRTNKIPYKGQEQQSKGFILQQILNLKKLQLTEIDNNSSVIQNNSSVTRDHEETDASSSIFESLEKLVDSVDHFQNCQDPEKDDLPLQELNVDNLPMPFSQPENFPLSSTTANPLLGESFWQLKSPVESGQLWSQNMQDLGVCEDINYNEDFNIPDVDITFRNFEELFGSEQDQIRALLDDKDGSHSSREKNMSLDMFHNRNARVREDTSIASSVYMSKGIHMDKDRGPSNQVYTLPSAPWTIRPSFSAMSFSVSRLSAESSASEYIDNELSPCIPGAEVQFRSSDQDGAYSGAKENAILNAILRHKEKQTTRMQEKQVHYGARKARNDARKRVKDQGSSEAIDVTRSY